MTDPEPSAAVAIEPTNPYGDDAVDSTDRTGATQPREPQWRVAPSAIGLWTVEMVLRSLVLMIPALAASIFVPESAPRWLVVGTDILPWALAALLVALTLVVPRYKYAVHRWEVTVDGIYTLTGWLSRTWVLVPISRIQTVDVTRGPLQRMFGLASVSVRTASAHGSVEIHQLEHYTAAQVADDLSKRANLYDDDAT